MADPRPLFYVTALVVLGLVVWVASVLLRPGQSWKLAAAPPKSGDPLAKVAKVDGGAVGPEAAVEEASASVADAPDHESPKNS